MNVGDKVKFKSDDLRSYGKVLRVHDDLKVGVLWVLKEGGILCQAESIADLVIINTKDKK